MKPHEEMCPVAAGQKFGKRGRWVTCSKDGIKGYRRVS